LLYLVHDFIWDGELKARKRTKNGRPVGPQRPLSLKDTAYKTNKFNSTARNAMYFH
jgi:hypothetical protein